MKDNLIQRGDLVQRLLRGLEIRPRSFTLEDSVVPIVVLEDLTRSSQWLESKDPGWFWSGIGPAVVGEIATIGVANNDDSTEIVVVERAWFHAGVTSDAYLITATSAASGAATLSTEFCVWADTRKTGHPAMTAEYGTSPAGVAPTEILARARFMSGGSMAETLWMTPVVLGPGMGLYLQPTVANAAITGGFSGRVITVP